MKFGEVTRKEMKQSENLTGPFAAEREKRIFRHSSNKKKELQGNNRRIYSGDGMAS